MKYVHTNYWRDLHAREDLSSVGQSALSGQLNRWIYRTIGRNLRRFARRHGLAKGRSRRMLEVGVGTGYWVEMWQKFGWQVDGCDLVPAAVDKLNAGYPSARFWAADVGSAEGVLASSNGVAEDGYDLVTVTSVLLHVTHPDAFDQALKNVAAAVRPGGHLLLVEPTLVIRTEEPAYDPDATSRARVLRSYVDPLAAQGLELVTVEATTVLAANPLEARSPRRLKTYNQWWAKVSRSRERPVVASLMGVAMYAADGVLIRAGEAPTSKVLLFRRPVQASLAS